MTTPTELISAAQSYAQGVIEAAQEAMEASSSSAGAMTLNLNPITPAPLPSAPPSSIDIDMPVFDPVSLTLPAEPGDAPVYQDISPLENVEFPTFSEVSPTLNMPNQPTSLPGFSGSLPGVSTDLDFPDMPSALSNPFPLEPTIPDRAEPTAPSVMLPSFDAITPVNSAVVPTNHQSQFEASYSGAAPSMVAFANGYVDAMLAQRNPRFAEQMAAIETQLATYMAGGHRTQPSGGRCDLRPFPQQGRRRGTPSARRQLGRCRSTRVYPANGHAERWQPDRPPSGCGHQRHGIARDCGDAG